jgi:hypothetical protein
MSGARVVERREDMSPVGRLVLILQEDGDVIVVVEPDPDHGDSSVEFCQPFTGGGRSRHTLAALRKLAEAMERDNAETPIYR